MNAKPSHLSQGSQYASRVEEVRLLASLADLMGDLDRFWHRACASAMPAPEPVTVIMSLSRIHGGGEDGAAGPAGSVG